MPGNLSVDVLGVYNNYGGMGGELAREFWFQTNWSAIIGGLGPGGSYKNPVNNGIIHQAQLVSESRISAINSR